MIAITLPSDQHRHDILNTIKTTPTFSKRLASFCDYLIDYIGTLTTKSLETSRTKHSINDDLIAIKNNQPNIKNQSKKTYNDNIIINSEISDQSDIQEELNDDFFQPQLQSIKQICTNNLANHEDDYSLSLNLLKAEEGHLSTSIQELIHQNHHLQRLHNQDRAILLKQHFIINESCFNDESDSSSSKPKRHYRKAQIGTDYSDIEDNDILHECKKLKRDFKHISHDINDLKQQVRQNYRISTKHKYC